MVVYIKSHKSGYSGRFLSYYKKNGDYRGRFLEENANDVVYNNNMKWKLKNYDGYMTLEN